MSSGIKLPPVIGHRGAAAHAPENTLESIRRAAELGAGGVEFDAKLTADGVPVLFHDELLDRTTTGSGPVEAISLAAIQALDAGSWLGPQWAGTRVPTLADTLQLILELGLFSNIEIKPCPGRELQTAYAVVQVVRAVWPKGHPWPLLSSFAVESLAAARDLAPAIPRGLLIWETPANWAEVAAALECVSVHPADEYLTPGWAAQIKGAGHALAVYTVNDPARAALLRSWGADSIITDAPDLLRSGPVVPTA